MVRLLLLLLLLQRPLSFALVVWLLVGPLLLLVLLLVLQRLAVRHNPRCAADAAVKHIRRVHRAAAEPPCDGRTRRMPRRLVGLRWG